MRSQKNRVLVGIFFLLSGAISLTYFVDTTNETSIVKEEPYPMSETIAKEFQPYVLDFLKGARTHNIENLIKSSALNLTIKFGNPQAIDPDFGGYCERFTLTIIIDKNLWNNVQLSRQALIDHEIGHCLLGRIHRHVGIGDKQNPVNFSPKSIMYPSSLNFYFYEYNKVALRKELFNPERFGLMEGLALHIHQNSQKIEKKGKGDRAAIKRIIADMEHEMNNEQILSQEFNFEDSPLIIEHSAKKDK